MIVAIGMDPGPTPGLVRLRYVSDADGNIAHLLDVAVVQCSANVFSQVLGVWLRACRQVPDTYVQVERFVIGRGSYRSGSPGALTRDQVGEAAAIAIEYGATVTRRSASETKKWATDGRLDAAGLLKATKGMTHARDAARHALFTAVSEGRIPDPLSRKARRHDG